MIIEKGGWVGWKNYYFKSIEWLFMDYHKMIIERLFKDYYKWLSKDYWKDYWKGGRGRIKKRTPSPYRHFTPRGWFWPRTPHFFWRNHLYMNPIWIINRFIFESSKCVFVVHRLIICWLLANNPDNQRLLMIIDDYWWLSSINSGVFSWWGSHQTKSGGVVCPNLQGVN